MIIRLISIEEVLPIRHEVMWPERSMDFVRVSGDEEASHYGLFWEEKLVSVVSVFSDGSSAQFRKFATLVDYQGQGFGTALLSKVFEELSSRNYHQVWCNARCEKVSFYQKFGLAVIGEPFEKYGKYYVKMLRQND